MLPDLQIDSMTRTAPKARQEGCHAVADQQQPSKLLMGELPEGVVRCSCPQDPPLMAGALLPAPADGLRPECEKSVRTASSTMMRCASANCTACGATDCAALAPSATATPEPARTSEPSRARSSSCAAFPMRSMERHVQASARCTTCGATGCAVIGGLSHCHSRAHPHRALQSLLHVLHFCSTLSSCNR